MDWCVSSLFEGDPRKHEYAREGGRQGRCRNQWCLPSASLCCGQPKLVLQGISGRQFGGYHTTMPTERWEIWGI